MTVTWYDGLLLLVLALFVRRGLCQEFGRGLLETAAILAALYFSRELAPLAAARLPLADAAHLNQGGWLLILLFVLLAVGLVFAWLLHSHSRWTMDALDPICGVAFGLAAGLFFAHGFTYALMELTNAPGYGRPEFLAHSFLTGELLHFRSLDAAMAALQRYQGGG